MLDTMNDTASLQSMLSSYIVSSFTRGRIFFSEDLEEVVPDRLTLRVILSRMVSDGSLIVRLAHGVYCYPGVDPSSFRMVLPSPGDIALAVARRYRVRIAPCGPRAAYLSGLVTLDPGDLDYLTDGSDQTIRLSGGRTIRFIKRKSLRFLDFRSEDLRNLSEGLRYIGSAHVEDSHRAVAARVLREVPPEDLRHDLPLCPAWVREEFRSLL